MQYPRCNIQPIFYLADCIKNQEFLKYLFTWKVPNWIFSIMKLLQKKLHSFGFSSGPPHLHHKSQAQSKPFVRWKRSSSKTSRSDVSASKSKQATVPFLRRLRCNSVNASNYAIWSSELQDTRPQCFTKNWKSAIFRIVIMALAHLRYV